MITQITHADTVATLREMKSAYHLTWGDFAVLLGTNRWALERIMSGQTKPTKVMARYIAQTAEVWKQNPPPPSPERRGGYRGDMCAQRAPRKQ